MARIGGHQPARGELQYAQPHGDEHLRLVVGADRLVGPGEDLRRGIAQHGHALQYDLGRHHEQRRGDALAGNVCYDQRQMVVVRKEEVVEVSAHFLGRGHGRVDVELPAVREGREYVGQHVRLYAGGQRKLQTYPLLLRSGFGKVFFELGQVAFHVRHYVA